MKRSNRTGNIGKIQDRTALNYLTNRLKLRWKYYDGPDECVIIKLQNKTFVFPFFRIIFPQINIKALAAPEFLWKFWRCEVLRNDFLTEDTRDPACHHCKDWLPLKQQCVYELFQCDWGVALKRDSVTFGANIYHVTEHLEYYLKK